MNNQATIAILENSKNFFSKEIATISSEVLALNSQLEAIQNDYLLALECPWESSQAFHSALALINRLSIMIKSKIISAKEYLSFCMGQLAIVEEKLENQSNPYSKITADLTYTRWINLTEFDQQLLYNKVFKANIKARKQNAAKVAAIDSSNLTIEQATLITKKEIAATA